MNNENYIDSAQVLIRKAQQTLKGVPVLDLTNWQSQRYAPGNSRTNLLEDVPVPHGACHNIEVKTTVDGKTDKCPIGVESSIVICTAELDPGATGNCPTDSTTVCPSGGTINTSTWVNMIAIFTMGADQTDVEVTFKYVLNGIPKQEKVIVDVVTGLNHVYAFATNRQYPADTSLVLYGAEVLV